MEGTDEIDIVKNINDKIKKWSEIALVDGNISSKISNWMVNEKAKAGKIHQLYKAHKPEKNYPGRTIQSVCGAPIEKITKWLEFYLSPIAQKCEYRIEDTNHILRKIDSFNSRSQGNQIEDAIHVTWDITAVSQYRQSKRPKCL